MFVIAKALCVRVPLIAGLIAVTSMTASPANLLPVAAAPVISLAAGVYSGTQTVTITDATPGATIYYTTNGSSPFNYSPSGSTPTTSASQYTGSVAVSTSETLVAAAIASGYSMSADADADFPWDFRHGPPRWGAGPFRALVARGTSALPAGGRVAAGP
jgi:hypothetical protein